MKRLLVVCALMVFGGICLGKDIIISSESCEYRDVSCDMFNYENWYKDEVSYNYALEDLDMLVYLVKTAYSGYEDAVKRGLKIDEIAEAFKKNYGENDVIKVAELSKFIGEYLSPYIQDCHFCIESRDFRKNLVTLYRVLYSDVYVKKADDGFVVEKSDNKDIQSGDIVEVETENLFLYPSEGDGIYRVGAYATMDENEKEISVNSLDEKKYIICSKENDYFWSEDITKYKEITTRKSLYIYIPTLQDLDNDDERKKIIDENFYKLHRISERYPGKKNIILDLRTNTGGNSLHTSKFLTNIYFREMNCDGKKAIKNLVKEYKIIGYDGNKINMISPSIVQAENWLSKRVFSDYQYIIDNFNYRKKLLKNQNLRIRYLEAEKVKPKNIKTKFPGKLIILTGKNSCSSSEHAVIEARGLFSKTNQFIQIGENTAGCYGYGNVWCYQLINSGIALHLASFISPFADKCPEGMGIVPDYWATNHDLVKAIANVTGDEALAEKLKDINKDL